MTTAQELILTGMCADSRPGAPLQRRFQYYFSINIATENTAPQKNNHYYNKGGTHQPTRMCGERHKVEFWDTRRKVILQAESFPCPEQFCASPHPEPKGCQTLCCPRAPPSSAELSVIDTRGNLVWWVNMVTHCCWSDATEPLLSSSSSGASKLKSWDNSVSELRDKNLDFLFLHRWDNRNKMLWLPLWDHYVGLQQQNKIPCVLSKPHRSV